MAKKNIANGGSGFRVSGPSQAPDVSGVGRSEAQLFNNIAQMGYQMRDYFIERQQRQNILEDDDAYWTGMRSLEEEGRKVMEKSQTDPDNYQEFLDGIEHEDPTFHDSAKAQQFSHAKADYLTKLGLGLEENKQRAILARAKASFSASLQDAIDSGDPDRIQAVVNRGVGTYISPSRASSLVRRARSAQELRSASDLAQKDPGAFVQKLNEGGFGNLSESKQRALLKEANFYFNSSGGRGAVVGRIAQDEQLVADQLAGGVRHATADELISANEKDDALGADDSAEGYDGDDDLGASTVIRGGGESGGRVGGDSAATAGTDVQHDETLSDDGAEGVDDGLDLDEGEADDEQVATSASEATDEGSNGAGVQHVEGVGGGRKSGGKTKAAAKPSAEGLGAGDEIKNNFPSGVTTEPLDYVRRCKGWGEEVDTGHLAKLVCAQIDTMPMPEAEADQLDYLDKVTKLMKDQGCGQRLIKLVEDNFNLRLHPAEGSEKFDVNSFVSNLDSGNGWNSPKFQSKVTVKGDRIKDVNGTKVQLYKEVATNDPDAEEDAMNNKVAVMSKFNGYLESHPKATWKDQAEAFKSIYKEMTGKDLSLVDIATAQREAGKKNLAEGERRKNKIDAEAALLERERAKQPEYEAWQKTELPKLQEKKRLSNITTAPVTFGIDTKEQDEVIMIGEDMLQGNDAYAKYGVPMIGILVGENTVYRPKKVRVVKGSGVTLSSGICRRYGITKFTKLTAPLVVSYNVK